MARVGMWIQRGNCPHMVESTMALMAAVLVDEKQGPSSEEQYGLRGQYANAFARYGSFPTLEEALLIVEPGLSQASWMANRTRRRNRACTLSPKP